MQHEANDIEFHYCVNKVLILLIFKLSLNYFGSQAIFSVQQIESTFEFHKSTSKRIPILQQQYQMKNVIHCIIYHCISD